MLNQTVIVGRLVNNPEKIEEEERKVAKITLAVPRSFKNADGEYETDYIPVRLFGGVAENTTEWCNKGDLVGIKGRLQSNDGIIELIAEKVTFLSQAKKDEE